MKKSYYCEKLEKTIHFLPDGVKYCCSCAEGAGMKIDDFSNFNEQDIIKTRENFAELLKNGKITPEGNLEKPFRAARKKDGACKACCSGKVRAKETIQKVRG